MKKVLTFFGLIVLASMLSMCDSAAVDYCDAWCDCTRCSDREYDNCVYDREDDEERAYNRNCGVEWEDYVACVVDTYYCHDYHLETDCRREHDDWRHCID